MNITSMPDIPTEVIYALSEWKTKYGPGIKIVKLNDSRTENGITLIFRPLTRGEASRISTESMFNPLESSNTILESLLLYPDSFDFDKLADRDFNDIVRAVWDTDGFGNEEKFLNSLDIHRGLLSTSLDKNMVAWICAAFKVTPDYVDKLTSIQLAEHLAYAEKIIGDEIPVESKERTKRKMTDPRYAMAAMRAQKLARKQEIKERRWAERMGIPTVTHDPDKAQEPAKAGETQDGRVMIDTAAENEALFRVRPELRWRDA